MDLSTGFVNYLVDEQYLSQILGGCAIDVYSGQKPSSADDAIGTQTLLYRITIDSVAWGAAKENGLTFTLGATAGTLEKTGNWTGVALATGTPVWFRLKTDPADTDLLSTTFRRIDGAVGVDMLIANTTCTSGETQVVTKFKMTIPR